MSLCNVSSTAIEFSDGTNSVVTITASASANEGVLTFTTAESGAVVNLAAVNDITSTGTINTTGALQVGGVAVATQAYVNSKVNGVMWLEPVVAATTGASTLASDFENADVVDGVTLATGDRILIKDQATASENGVYTVNASGPPSRVSELDDAVTAANASVMVSEGTVNADKGFTCTNDDGSDVVGTDNLTFIQFTSSGGGFDTAGTGCTSSGSTLNVIAGVGLTANANDIEISAGGVGTAQLATGAVTAPKIANAVVDSQHIATGAIDPAHLANDAVTADKLAADAVVNASVAAAAGIVASKIAGGTFAAGTYSFTGSTVSDLGSVTTADINGGTIDGVNVTVGAGVTLDTTAGTLTTSTAQKLAIVQGVGADTDIGPFNLRAATLTADSMTSTLVPFFGTNGLLSENAAFKFTTETGKLESTIVTSTSDARMKDDITTITPEEGLAVMCKSRGVHFVWKKNGQPSAGVIAQEAQEIVPELVHTDADGDIENKLSMNWSGYHGYTIAAFQALVARIETLEAKLANAE